MIIVSHHESFCALHVSVTLNNPADELEVCFLICDWFV